MTLGLRRLLAVVVVVASFALAALLSAQHRSALSRDARIRAEAAAEAAWTRVAGGLQPLPDGLTRRAAMLAETPGLEALIRETVGEIDDEQLKRTVEDFNDSEHWFQRAVKDEVVGLFVADRPIFIADPTLLEPLTKPVAEVAQAEGRLLALKDQPWLVGFSPMKARNKRQEVAVVALARPLTSDDLLAFTDGVSVQVIARDPAQLVGAGDPAGLERLSRRRTRMKADTDEAACCVTREVAPGVQLAVFKDPAPLLAEAELAASRGQWPRFAIAAAVSVLAVLGLLLLGRRRKDDAERDQLLRETQAQLKQSQEVLQRLSTGAYATQMAGGLATSPGATDDALASTQASAVPSRYEVVAPLGGGGMAKVSIAVVRGAEGFKRSFVVKRLKAEHQGNQELVNQFIDEARLGASLVHSNVVPIFDFGRDAEGYYLAQEYILGRDVDALLAASLSQRGRPLEPAIVITIAQETLKALAYAHSRTNDAGQPMGLVHHDVSPANLMVSQRGEVKLLDFGIVKSNERVTHTQAGMVKGNLFYMSPEQARALPVDPRSDLFSLGMVMATALLGTPLYTGNTMYELMTRAAAGPTADDLEKVRAGCGPLSTFLLKTLSIDPAGRFVDANAMASALSSVGPGATAQELERLMAELLGDVLADEQRRFAGAS
ncbi:MAG: serine/threonine-protein kinase [Myxococcaceae bacterium]|nr:serine/threonine-protein kinase [Myxococcaceae bacterium]